jgi:hypothetical protein
MAEPRIAAVLVSWSSTKKWHRPRSTDIGYATNFRATRAIGVASLFFFVMEHGQFRAHP